MYGADGFPVPPVKDRVGSARMMAAKAQSLPKNPYSKGTGGDYPFDRPPLMDVLNKKGLLGSSGGLQNYPLNMTSCFRWR